MLKYCFRFILNFLPVRSLVLAVLQCNKESCLPGTSVINNILKLFFASGVILNLPWYLKVTVGAAFSPKKVDLGRGSLRHTKMKGHFLI